MKGKKTWKNVLAEKSGIYVLELVGASYFNSEAVGFSTPAFLESHLNLVKSF